MGADLKKLKPVHEQAIRLYCHGVPIQQIERVCGLTQGYGSKILNSPLCQARLKDLMAGEDKNFQESMKHARELVSDNAEAMVTNLIDIAFRSEKDSDRISATAKALAFAEGGDGETRDRTPPINIFVRGQNGDLEKRGVFDNIDVDKEPAPDTAQKTLALMEAPEDALQDTEGEGFQTLQDN